MSNKSSSSLQATQGSTEARPQGVDVRPPAELQEQLQAISQVLVTQPSRAWHQSSWVPITTASLLVSVVGLVMIHKLTQPVREGSSLSVSEQLLSLLDSPRQSQSLQSAPIHAQWQADLADLSQSQPAFEPQFEADKLALQGQEFFAKHGAPSYFCITNLETQDWQLKRCEVQQLGSELISVRYYSSNKEETTQASQSRVYTVKRDALCRQSLSQLQDFERQHENAQMFEYPCSVSILVID